MSTPSTPGSWIHRSAVATVLCAVPLVLFGGSVTTLGAGMAVEGWLIAEGHFLLLFPIESWLRDTGTFVEHTHRLFGVLVGLVALVTCAGAWLRASRGAALWASAALVAVCLQGALGGFRVLENSPQLAFLHGIFAQATFALMAAAAVVLSPRWRRQAEAASLAGGERLGRIAAVATLVVFAQVALGAWYRHGLRPAAVEGVETRLALHIAGAVLAFAAVAYLAAATKALATGALSAGREVEATLLRSRARRLHALLGLQVLLGLFAWVGYRPAAIAPLEWFLSIAHVLGGALLLAQCFALVLWGGRLTRRAPASLAAPRPGLEGVR